MKFRRDKEVIDQEDFPEWLQQGVRFKKHAKKRKKRAHMVMQFRKNGNDRKPLSVLKHTYGLKCDQCGREDKLTIHHKIPLSYGGTNHPSNIAILCRFCHSEKHHRKVIG